MPHALTLVIDVRPRSARSDQHGRSRGFLVDQAVAPLCPKALCPKASHHDQPRDGQHGRPPDLTAD
ncbi:hypothetical protein [Pseudofrankia asymbiotica]|uniref:Uncharacterized protein n=1 Tax=Pseudofrankia asymbiotica TaxID=1834516 RepID=A0A1V2I148_9ACTN|nr:hypothetical protein [Pseudofrankia asymbiotica]ONH21932.1 hypothetical protein BL253_37295 [Pseudofrankia asymbiotica]